MRSARMRLLSGLLAPFSRPASILDVGGTASFWEMRGWADRPDIRITLLNLSAQSSGHSHIRSVAGDATDLSRYDDGAFDIVFSNSVIEHLFTLDRQKQMGREVARVGRAYMVQTPNYWFPIEPHFHVPGWQWMPRRVRIELLRRWRCGWRGPCPDRETAASLVDEVRLLTWRELAYVFPDGLITAERVGGFVKSWVVLRSASGRISGLKGP